ncbi:MAG: tRNA lysidine(34) synthetase TilS [Fibrobacter sp.]|nr:tRNA lysidine(34) synthetase TilS [Fibrobacter sp.]
MSLNLVENIRHHGFKRLLLAVSGGLDSICLAHYFIENSAALGIEWLGIAHVHHGLREGTADRDAKFVEEFAKSHDVPFFLKKLDGEALKDAEGSLEENARDARYKALVEIALNKKWRSRNGVRDDIEEGCVTIAIVTAHHAGDQAETMYMRLKRGTTLAGLRGIQEVRIIQDDTSFVSRLSSLVYIFRPFLNVTRNELLTYARENGLSWCEDESNADVKFARNKIRHEFLPNLERECPGAIRQLSKIAGLADKAYAKVIAKCSRSFDFAQDDTRGFPLTSASPQGDKWRFQNRVRDDNAHSASPQDDTSLVSRLSSFVSLDKKKLNKILREYADADLSEMFRLWLTEKGFRFPIGFFYGPKEPAHVKIPVRAVYRRRSVVKIAHTVWICEFKDALSAAKFVSCEKKEKDYNEST